MKLHELKAPQGATKAPKRKGRGTATGQGKTAGRGMNGQNSRSGGGVRLGLKADRCLCTEDCLRGDLPTSGQKSTP